MVENKTCDLICIVTHTYEMNLEATNFWKNKGKLKQAQPKPKCRKGENLGGAKLEPGNSKFKKGKSS